MNRIPFDEVQELLASVLGKLGFSDIRAKHCALLFAETTRDGVYTHGINRFPRFEAMIKSGVVNAGAEPELTAHFGAMERWNGHLGPGNLNAFACMERAVALSRNHGIGFVALLNTNHWMRAGTYGWQAAEAGFIGICWTNTLPNMPAWGGLDPCIGNNPLVIAVPREKGPVVLDMAISQFSYGAIESYKLRGELLPIDGGFDAEGNLTRDPAAIENSLRPLSIGYWKGSGLAVVLDMVAAMTSLGLATHQLTLDPLKESGISQVFIAINPAAFGPEPKIAQLADDIVDSLHRSRAAKDGAQIRYPGEQTLRIRAENLELGLPVDPAVWAQIQAM